MSGILGELHYEQPKGSLILKYKCLNFFCCQMMCLGGAEEELTPLTTEASPAVNHLEDFVTEPSTVSK
uniref:Ovule protein n=1 Tax=Echinococcus granulosus TaxID=6210 RepID=A0A068WBW6_ECHGR|nr:hypothetical protein EgrG_002013200 [Echinococcus granulosus]